MSSNVDMLEPEESHHSPADSADPSEQSPYPAKTPPPPPKGSYAAVDRGLLYTVRSLTAISTAHDSILTRMQCFVNGRDEEELRSRFVLLRMRVMDVFGWVTGAVLTNKIMFT
jgi:hypothetical protein